MSTIELIRTADPSQQAGSPPQPGPRLTRRELVVLTQLLDGATLEEIATRLFVTRNTVKSQVRSLYRKIGVQTRLDAITWALAAGIR